MGIFFGANAFAQGGEVILDLQDDNYHQNEGFSGLLEVGGAYIRDVKEYNALLGEDYEIKDLSADIKSKYSFYDDNKAEEWQGYVKKGIKYYREWENIKSKVISFFTDMEPPLVVDDDQYEMGGQEKYIESDKPVVIHDFKKVVAYSNQKKDRLAAKEKSAKDKGLPSLAEKIAGYKKAILEKNWSEIFDFGLKKWVNNIHDIPDVVNDVSQKFLIATILTEYSNLNEKGEVKGVIQLEPKEKRIFLLSNYGKYEGAKVDFSGSENLRDIEISFVKPQTMYVPEGHGIQFYASKFFVFFKAKAEDLTKAMILRPTVEGEMCAGWDCVKEKVSPELVINKEDKVKKSPFATFVNVVENNIPNESNKYKFEFDGPWLRKDENVLQLTVKTDDAVYLDAFIIGEAAKYFRKPVIRFENKKADIRFEQIDNSYNISGKDISFWISTSNAAQYIYKSKVRKISEFKTDVSIVTWGILFWTFVGGVLLNFTPAGLALLLSGMLSYNVADAKKAGCSRYSYVYGICATVVSAAFCTIILKFYNLASGWGNLFQNIWFMMIVLWGLIGALACKISLCDYFINSEIKQKNAVEFVGGMFGAAVLLVFVPDGLAEFFNVALFTGYQYIPVMFLALVSGMIAPYMALAYLTEKKSLHLSEQGKYFAKKAVIILLVLAIVQLILFVSAQTSELQFFVLLSVVTIIAGVLWVAKIYLKEADKLENKEVAAIIKSKYKKIFVSVVLFIVLLCWISVGFAYCHKKEYVAKNYMSAIDLEIIAQKLRTGRKVLLKVGANWCVSCKYNDLLVFDKLSTQDAFNNNKVVILDVDWTNYQPEIFKYMQNFDRNNVPFYVLFSKKFPAGVVLPKKINEKELNNLIEM